MNHPNLHRPLRVLVTTPNLDTAGSKFVVARSYQTENGLVPLSMGSD